MEGSVRADTAKIPKARDIRMVWRASPPSAANEESH
jgi:hypothetical protein